MRSRILDRSIPFLLLGGALCAPQPLGAGNTLGKAGAAAAMAAVAYLGLSAPEAGAPWPAVPGRPQPGPARQEPYRLPARGPLDRRGREALPLMALKVITDPEDIEGWAVHQMFEATSLFQIPQSVTQADGADLVGLVASLTDRLGALAAASALEVERLQGGMPRGGAAPESPDGLNIHRLALRVAELQDLVYRGFQGLLLEMRPGGLDDRAAIRRLGQDAFTIYLALGLPLDIAFRLNQKLIERLTFTRDSDEARPKDWPQDRLERELTAARRRAEQIDATKATVEVLIDWKPGAPSPG